MQNANSHFSNTVVCFVCWYGVCLFVCFALFCLLAWFLFVCFVCWHGFCLFVCLFTRVLSEEVNCQV